MSNEDKLFELMTKMYEEMQKEFKKISEDLEDTKKELQSFREETNTRFDKLENKLDDIEANNANRHLIINQKIKNIKSTLSKIEIVTADNWSDIARLKKIVKHK